MVACLEKIEENAKFHQIVDFLSTCSINYALTAMVISESSVRSDILYNDENGEVTSLFDLMLVQNQAPKGEDKAVHQEGGDSVERAITTDASLVTAEDSDNIAKTQYTTMVLALEQFKSAQDLVIKRLQKKVKRLEKKQRERTPRMKLFKIGTSKKKTLDNKNVSKHWRDESNRTEELNLSNKESGETEVFDYATAAEKDVNAAEPVSTDGDAINSASVIPDVSVAGPFTSTAEDIFKDEMKTMADWTRVDHNLLNDFNMATNEIGDDVPHAGGGDLPVPDLQTMEELCQPTLNGDDANKHLDKFLHVTQSIKVNGVTDDALCLYLFPHSLTHHATTWFDRFPRNSITTFEQMDKMFLRKYFPPSMVTKLRNEITSFCQCPDESLFKAWEHYKLSIDRCPNHNMLPVTQIDTFYNGLTLRHRDTINALAGGTFMKRRPEECYDLIENMTAHQNEWDTSDQRSESSSSINSSSDLEIVALKAEMVKINKNPMKVLQINQQVKAVTLSCETWGGPHSYNDCPATVGQTQNVYAVRAYNQGGNSYQP
nr:hypothetical protein [Tanacetum cinerariifolium]